MNVIDGKKIAEDILVKLKSRPKPNKFMGAALVGDDPASMSFLNQKKRFAGELGIDFRLYELSADLKNDDLRREVRKLAGHKTCGGFIVQLPLPDHINGHYILNVIPREKDIDVLSERALGAFYVGRNPVLPPAVGTVEEIVKASGVKYQESRVAIVGLGLLIGRPIANWLMDKAKEVYLLHRGSDFGILNRADLVISGVGEAGIIKPEMLQDGAGVIDFGYGKAQTPSRTHADRTRTSAEKDIFRGDLDASSSSLSSLSFYTPTPGGTGPVLVAKLFENFYKLNANW